MRRQRHRLRTREEVFGIHPDLSVLAFNHSLQNSIGIVPLLVGPVILATRHAQLMRTMADMARIEPRIYREERENEDTFRCRSMS